MSMGKECTCDKVNTANVNLNAKINAPQTNVSGGNVHFEIEELNYGTISLKGLKGNISTTITDENVRIQSDLAGKLFMQLIGKFGDALVDNIKVNAERQRQRIKEIDRDFEAEHKYDDAREKRRQEEHEADLKYKEEQTRYYASQAKYYDEQAATEKSRRIREEQQDKKH